MESFRHWTPVLFWLESSGTFHLLKLCSSIVMIMLHMPEACHSPQCHLCTTHGVECCCLFLIYFMLKSQEENKYFAVERCQFSPPVFVDLILAKAR